MAEHPLLFSVPKLYRDCIRLADYISQRTGNRATLRKTVQSQFRRNAGECDPEKIQEHKAAAVRGLQNFMFHEAHRMAQVPKRIKRIKAHSICTTALHKHKKCKARFTCRKTQARRVVGPRRIRPSTINGNSMLRPLQKDCKGSLAVAAPSQPVRIAGLGSTLQSRAHQCGRKDQERVCLSVCASSRQAVVSEEDDLEWDLATGSGPSAEEAAELEAEAERFAEEFSGFGPDTIAIEAEVAEDELPKKRGVRRAQRPRATAIPLHCLPKLAIVGRPNVGKSALFNRIASSNLAIVYDYPGVTRDRQYTRASWGVKEFVVVDTGGLMSDATKLPATKQTQAIRGISDEDLPHAIERQAAAGVAEADCLLLVVDGQTGLTATDEEIVGWLRKAHPDKPVTLAVNKCENIRTADTQAAEFWNTGHEPIAVSAISGTGTGDLMDRLAETLPPPKSVEELDLDDAHVPVAIIGRPNVGKSSLLNALVGSERSIVSAVSGTTRDAVDTQVATPEGQRFTLIDTAGIRKRAAVSDSLDGAEPLSVQRALQAMRRAQVAVLVLDAVDCTVDGRFVVRQQDYRLSESIANEGRACVVVVNKWDAIPFKDSQTLAAYQKELLAQLRLIDWATVVFASAHSGQRVRKILTAAAAAAEEHNRRISTATLNMVVQETINWRAPPTSKAGKKGRIYYATQAAVRPPTFVFFVNDTQVFTEDYRKYVERQLRENVGFPGSPLRVFWRGKAAKPRALAAKQ